MKLLNITNGINGSGGLERVLSINANYVDKKQVKTIGNIPENERLIMMIGIGKYKDSFEVAISDRIDVKDIITINE